MTAGDLKIASLAFIALTLTVAVNMFAMQDTRRAGTRDTAQQKPRSSFDETVEAALSKPDLAVAHTASALKIAPPKGSAGEPANSAEITRGIQRELNQRGYEAGQPDGVAGLVTRAAILAYEHDYGLPLTATPSQDVLSRIVLGSSVPQAPRPGLAQAPSGDAEGVILAVKQQLAQLGYTIGKVDGRIDDRAARAIREFEIDQKLPESGRISGPLMSRLLALKGQPAAAGASPSQSPKQPPTPAATAKADTPPRTQPSPRSAAAPAAKAKPATR